MLIIAGLIAVAVIALVAAFLVARGGDKHSKSAPAVQIEPEQPTIETSTSTPALEIEESLTDLMAETEKRPAISSFQRQQLAARSQSEEHLKQLDFPDNPLSTYINLNRGTTVSDFKPDPGAALSERWTLEPSQYSERDVTVLKRQLYELAGQLHLMQHKSRAIEQRVIEISTVLERMDNEQQSRSNAPESSSPLSYNGID
jgi:hypothetical protein